MLGTTRVFLILKSLDGGAKDRLELRRAAGFPAQSTLRRHLGTLEAATAVSKGASDSMPGALEYDLTNPGRDLLTVALGLDCWLKDAPMGPLELGSDQAKAAIKGLVEGWSTEILTKLAAGPLSLTALDKQISGVSYPTIERCLETMRLTEQIEVGARTSTGTPCTLSDWLRRGLGPLILGARWEHRHLPDGAAPICRLDVEDAITVIAPLLELAPELSGICQLAVKTPEKEQRRRFLISVEVNGGDLSVGAVYPDRKPNAWASGEIETWFSAVIDEDSQGLKMSGDCDLLRAVFDPMRHVLFESEVGATSGAA